MRQKFRRRFSLGLISKLNKRKILATQLREKTILVGRSLAVGSNASCAMKSPARQYAPARDGRLPLQGRGRARGPMLLWRRPLRRRRRRPPHGAVPRRLPPRRRGRRGAAAAGPDAVGRGDGAVTPGEPQLAGDRAPPGRLPRRPLRPRHGAGRDRRLGRRLGPLVGGQREAAAEIARRGIRARLHLEHLRQEKESRWASFGLKFYVNAYSVCFCQIVVRLKKSQIVA
jgi:hypothetical protein